MEILSICLSDIPKDRITTGKNGKKYLNIIIAARKEKDQFGNDLTVYVSQGKDEREAKANKIYIGSGRAVLFNQSDNKPAPERPTQEQQGDDLPF